MTNIVRAGFNSAQNPDPHLLSFFSNIPYVPPRYIADDVLSARLADSSHCLRSEPICVTSLVARYPRGVKWTDFPFFSSADYQLLDSETCERSSVGGFHCESMRSANCVSYIEFVKHSASQSRLEFYRSKVSAFHRSYCPGTDLYVKKVVQGCESQSVFRKVDPEYFGRAAAGTLHLRYNYGFNARAIIKPLAVEFSGSRPELPCGDSGRWEHVSDGVSFHSDFFRRFGGNHLFSDPVCLQFLFQISDIDEEDERILFRLLSGELFSSEIHIGRAVRSGQWVGTGKYDPVALGPLWEQYIFSFLSFGFLDVDHLRGVLRLSRAGHSFLSALHKCCNDPDLPLRFSDTAPGLASADQTGRIDDALKRFFRKTKAKSQS